MFGYVKTAQPELKLKELTRYRAYYCGVCRAMSAFTLIGRSVLSYDLAFYALLTDPYAKADIINKRCKWNLQKRPYAMGESITYAGALNLLLSYHKIKDDVQDGERYKKLLLLLFMSAYKKAGMKAQQAEESIVKQMDRITELEKQKCAKIDVIAHEFAELCADLCSEAPNIDDAYLKKTLHYISYHVARWVYIIDAYDDMEEDTKNGNYNPIIEEAKTREMSNREITDWIKEVLFCTLYEAGKGVNLLPDSANTPIIANIINCGLHDQTVQILKKKEIANGSI